MSTPSRSHGKQPFCISDNYLFLVIHLCAIAVTARVLFSILYPPFFDGDQTMAGKASIMSTDLLKIKSVFFWYASIPFLYVAWKRVCGAGAGIVVTILTAIPGIFVGEWIAKAGSRPEMIFLVPGALFLYPLCVIIKHAWIVKHHRFV